MVLREWLEGGLPGLQQQADDAFANYNQALGAKRAIEATLRWLDENKGAGDEPAPNPSDGKVKSIG